MSGSTIISYPTIEAGIDATAATLHNLVVERKLSTVEKLGFEAGSDRDTLTRFDAKDSEVKKKHKHKNRRFRQRPDKQD